MEFCVSLRLLNQRVIHLVAEPGIATCDRKETLFCCATQCLSLLALLAFVLCVKRKPDGQRRGFPCWLVGCAGVYWLPFGIPAPC
ncbi:Uncharacterised protein [Klebsiella grimontii]|nr:Uncharacterised protein [Klebsiella grimontii]